VLISPEDLMAKIRAARAKLASGEALDEDQLRELMRRQRG
jgi:hypothetical protein